MSVVGRWVGGWREDALDVGRLVWTCAPLLVGSHTTRSRLSNRGSAGGC